MKVQGDLVYKGERAHKAVELISTSQFSAQIQPKSDS